MLCGFYKKNLLEIVLLLNSVDKLLTTANSLPTEKKAATTASAMSALQQIRSHFSFKSPLFRHACRMSLCLVAAYGLLQLFNIKQGFWVLLTCLFVCQSSYTATRRRLFQRIAGTCSGLMLSLPLLWFSPEPGIQLILMAVAAVLFLPS